MKLSGIVRKIDDLGRIVIPKELRKSLNIKDGEEIEIFLSEEGIILKKYYRIVSFKENSKKYIDIFNKIYNYEIILTDRDKVVYSTVDNQNLEAIKLTNDIVRSIEERKEYKNTTLKLSSDIILNCNYLFIPVIIDTDALGSLILISNHDIKHEDELNLRLLYHLIKLELL